MKKFEEKRQPRNVPMSYHMCMNLDTAIEMAQNSHGNPQGINGLKTIREMFGRYDDPQHEIVGDLLDMKKAGMTAIPGEGCNNHEFGHCKGHVKRGVIAGKLHA